MQCSSGPALSTRLLNRRLRTKQGEISSDDRRAQLKYCKLTGTVDRECVFDLDGSQHSSTLAPHTHTAFQIHQKSRKQNKRMKMTVREAAAGALKPKPKRDELEFGEEKKTLLANLFKFSHRHSIGFMNPTSFRTKNRFIFMVWTVVCCVCVERYVDVCWRQRYTTLYGSVYFFFIYFKSVIWRRFYCISDLMTFFGFSKRFLSG